MLKQFIAIIAFSLLIIVMMPNAQHGLQLILNAHNWVANILTDVFSVGPTGSLIRQLLALLAIPFIIALIPTLVYWLAKRHWFPHFMAIVSIVWLVQTSALVILYKTAVPETVATATSAAVPTAG